MSIIDSNVGFSAIQNAQTGIARGMSALNRDAAVIANGSDGTGLGEDVVGALIDASQQKLYIQASAKALSIADDAMSAALGQLVDTHA
jgi:hypothetical protein